MKIFNNQQSIFISIMEKETSRLSRLTAILTLLQSKRLVTATAISKKFNISIRTVYRDIKALEASGIPIITEEGKGYRLMEGYHLPPVLFTEKEANALITAEQLIIKNKDASFIKNYQEALIKVKAVLRYGMKEKVELLSERIVFRQNANNEVTSNYLADIQLAITHLKLVQIKYQALQDNSITARTIEPLALYTTQENWILIAWCRLRNDYRSFRLDKIQQLTIFDETYKSRNFNLQEYFNGYKEKYFLNP